MSARMLSQHSSQRDNDGLPSIEGGISGKTRQKGKHPIKVGFVDDDEEDTKQHAAWNQKVKSRNAEIDIWNCDHRSLVSSIRDARREIDMTKFVQRWMRPYLGLCADSGTESLPKHHYGPG